MEQHSTQPQSNGAAASSSVPSQPSVLLSASLLRDAHLKRSRRAPLHPSHPFVGFSLSDSTQQRKQQQQQQQEREEAEANKMRSRTKLAPLAFPQRSTDHAPMRIPSLTPRLPGLSSDASGCSACVESKEVASAAQLDAEAAESAVRSIQDEVRSLAQQLQDQQQCHAEERDQAFRECQDREQLHNAFLEATVAHASESLEQRQLELEQRHEADHEARVKQQEERAQQHIEELQHALEEQMKQARVDEQKREERYSSCEERLRTHEARSAELEAALQSRITSVQHQSALVAQNAAIRAELKTQIQAQQTQRDTLLQQAETRHEQHVAQLQSDLTAANTRVDQLQQDLEAQSQQLESHTSSLSKLSDLKKEVLVLEGQILALKEELATARNQQQGAEAHSRRAVIAAAVQLSAHAQPTMNLFPAAGVASSDPAAAPLASEAKSPQPKPLSRDAAAPVTADPATLMADIAIDAQAMPSAPPTSQHQQQPGSAEVKSNESAAAAAAEEAKPDDAHAAANASEAAVAGDADGLVAVTALSDHAQSTELEGTQADLQAAAHQSDEEDDDPTPARRKTSTHARKDDCNKSAEVKPTAFHTRSPGSAQQKSSNSPAAAAAAKASDSSSSKGASEGRSAAGGKGSNLKAAVKAQSKKKRKEPAEPSTAGADSGSDGEWTLTGNRERRESKPRTILNQKPAPKRARVGSKKKQQGTRSKRKQSAVAAAVSADEADSDAEANEIKPPQSAPPTAPAVLQSSSPSALPHLAPLSDSDELIDLRSPSPAPQTKRAASSQPAKQSSTATVKPIAAPSAHTPVGNQSSLFDSAPAADPFAFDADSSLAPSSGHSGAQGRSSAKSGSSASKPLLLHLSQSQRPITPSSAHKKKARAARQSTARRSPVDVQIHLPTQRQQQRAQKSQPVSEPEPPRPSSGGSQKRLFGSPDDVEDDTLLPLLQSRVAPALSPPHFSRMQPGAGQQEDVREQMRQAASPPARIPSRSSSVIRPVPVASRKRVSAAKPKAARASAISRSLTQPPEDMTDDPFAFVNSD